MAERRLTRKLIKKIPQTDAIDAPLGFNLTTLHFRTSDFVQVETFLDPMQAKKWANYIFEYTTFGTAH